MIVAARDSLVRSLVNSKYRSIGGARSSRTRLCVPSTRGTSEKERIEWETHRKGAENCE
jgi:hypothetical protein